MLGLWGEKIKLGKLRSHLGRVGHCFATLLCSVGGVEWRCFFHFHTSKLHTFENGVRVWTSDSDVDTSKLFSVPVLSNVFNLKLLC